MENPGQFVKRAVYARMRGWDRSYITKLQKQDRVVFSSDGALVDWAATDALIGYTADPSKVGVQQRWADERAQQQMPNIDASPAAVADASVMAAGFAAASPAGAAPKVESPFHQARAEKEHYNGQMARLEYEWVTGLLVSRPRVEDASHTIGRSLRDRVLGMAPRIAPELAAIGDAWELEKQLTAALRQVLDDVAAVGATIMRDLFNDPAQGKVAELIRAGKERYDTKPDNPAAP